MPAPQVLIDLLYLSTRTRISQAPGAQIPGFLDTKGISTAFPAVHH